MNIATAPIWFALSIASAAMAAHGAVALVTARRLEARLSRLVAPSPVRRAQARLRVPAALQARGRDGMEIQEKLRQAGFQNANAVDRFLLFRLLATGGVFGFILFVSLAFSGGPFAHPLLLILGPAGTYLGSKRLLAALAAARVRAITIEFPFLLDLMLMMLESGVSLDQCFRTIARDQAGAAPKLAATIQALVTDLDRGNGYETALDRWAEKVAAPGAKELASIFQQGLFQGIELGPALRTFVREFTERRVATARESVGRISVQLVVVMVFFFMPAVFIVVAGPPVAALLDVVSDTGK